MTSFVTSVGIGRAIGVSLVAATLWGLPPTSAAAVIYRVDLMTLGLVDHPAGPFSLEFQLTDGNADVNSITVGSFDFGGGSAVSESPTLVGGASGSLFSQVVLQDTDFLNQFIQSFNPGSELSFLVTLTANFDGGFFPDQFSFSILDSTGAELPTEGLGDSILAIDLVPPLPPPRTFGGDPNRPPAAGGDPIAFEAPSVRVVPEPGSLALGLGGIACLAARYRRRRVSR